MGKKYPVTSAVVRIMWINTCKTLKKYNLPLVLSISIVIASTFFILMKGSWLFLLTCILYAFFWKYEERIYTQSSSQIKCFPWMQLCLMINLSNSFTYKNVYVIRLTWAWLAGKYTWETEFGKCNFPTSLVLKMLCTCFAIMCALVESYFLEM